MTDHLNIEEIIKILKIVLKTNEIDENSEMGSPPQWNSLTHIAILLAIEAKLKIKIELHNLPLLTSVKKIYLFFKD